MVMGIGNIVEATKSSTCQTAGAHLHLFLEPFMKRTIAIGRDIIFPFSSFLLQGKNKIKSDAIRYYAYVKTNGRVTLHVYTTHGPWP